MSLLVITPTLGDSRFLKYTVASVSAVGGEIRHILVCPAAKANDLRTAYPLIEVIADDTPGIYAAINTAISTVPEWEFCTWINDDDQLLDGFAKTIAATKTGRAEVIYGDVAYIDEHGRELGRMPVARPRSVAAVLAKGQAALTQQGTLIARGLWERLHGLDLRWRLAADCDFWCRSVVAGAIFQQVPARVAAFRLHSGQLSGERLPMEREIREIHRVHEAALLRESRWGGSALFRLGSLARILERRWCAGVWTSRGLYARYSTRS